MKLIVGLGNPGPQYETTRHNAGFLMADLLAEEFGLSWSGQKFDAVFAKGTLLGEAVVMLKPQTFMNLSGRAVAKAMQFYKLSGNDVIVLHDEVDLAPGVVKARVGGGHGGHNGIRSILAETGESEFHRIKLGVGRPAKDAMGGPSQMTQWVLGPFSDSELLELQKGMFEAVILRLKNVIQG